MSLHLGESLSNDLIWRPPARLLEGEPFVREVLFDELVSTRPKDAQVRAVVYQSELASVTAVPWHIHNGPIFALLLQGEIILQFPGVDEGAIGEEYHYKAGDVFVEPVGVLHRAYNPNPDLTLLSLAFQVTSDDREPIVAMASAPLDHRPRTAKAGVPQPQMARRKRIEGSR